jgi:hypothetical protein
MGEVGLWQLREAYEDVVGKRPRRDWSWDRTARELFYEYDRLHVAAVLGLFEAGKKAEASGDLDAMRRAYDAVLTRTPLFERAPEMAKGYFAYAERAQTSAPDQAKAALVRVERLTTDSALRARARSLHDTILASRRMNAGVFDAFLLQKAVDHDATNQQAKALLRNFDEKAVETLTHRVRWMTSGAIALISLIALGLVLIRRKPGTDRLPSHTPSPEPEAERDASPNTTAPNAAGKAPTADTEYTAVPVADRREHPETAVTAELERHADQEPPPKILDPFEGL